MTRKQWQVALLAMMVSVAAVAVVRAAGGAKGRPTAVAVVDVGKVFNDAAEKKQIEADQVQRREKLQVEMQAKSNELNDMKKDMEMLNAANPAKKAKIEELARKAFELRAWQEWQLQQIQSDSVNGITDLYRKIQSAAGKVAKENGYDVVLYREGTLDFTRVKPENLELAIANRKVLWAADDLDVTPLVVQVLDNEFKNNMNTGTKTPK